MADLNWIATYAVRNSDFETMMRYSYYILSEDRHAGENERLKIIIEHIIVSAKKMEYADLKIYEFKLSAFVLIMDYVRTRFAKDKEAFIAYSLQFRTCLQALLDNDLIDANPMDQLLEMPDYYGKYWPS